MHKVQALSLEYAQVQSLQFQYAQSTITPQDMHKVQALPKAVCTGYKLPVDLPVSPLGH